jgi:hypothetical protein
MPCMYVGVCVYVCVWGGGGSHVDDEKHVFLIISSILCKYKTRKQDGHNTLVHILLFVLVAQVVVRRNVPCSWITQNNHKREALVIIRVDLFRKKFCCVLPCVSVTLTRGVVLEPRLWGKVVGSTFHGDPAASPHFIARRVVRAVPVCCKISRRDEKDTRKPPPHARRVARAWVCVSCGRGRQVDALKSRQQRSAPGIAQEARCHLVLSQYQRSVRHLQFGALCKSCGCVEKVNLLGEILRFVLAFGYYRRQSRFHRVYHVEKERG